MTLSPITAEPATPGCDSGPAPSSPTATGRAASFSSPRERYEHIAFRLNVTVRQAELLWFLSQREIAQSEWLMNRMGLNCDTIKVHACNLRKQGLDVRARKFIGYFLKLADRQRVLAAASVAPSSGALPSEDSSRTGGRANAATTFQPIDDASRDPAQHVPCHSVPASLAGSIDQQESGTCIPTNGTLHP